MIRNNKGAVSVIIIVVVLILSLIAIYGLRISGNNYEIVILKGEKKKSNSLSDHALNKYLERIVAYYENGEDITLPAGFNESSDVMDGLEKVGSYSYSYDPTESIVVDKFVLQKRTKTKQYIHRMYHLNPPLDTVFTPMTDQLEKDMAQIAISGIYNEIVNSLEFYAVTYDDREGMLRLYSYQPFIDDGFAMKSEILVNDLYKIKNPASTKDSLSLHDDIDVDVLWNSNFNSLEVYLAIGDREAGEIDIFRNSPYIDATSYEHLETLAEPFNQMAFAGVYDMNINDIELFITLLKDDRVVFYNSHPTLGVDGEFAKTLVDFADDIMGTFDRIDMTVLWNRTLNSSNMYVSTVADTNDEAAYYLFLPHINEQVVKQTELTMNAATMGAGFEVSQIAIGSYFDDNFNAPQLYSAVGEYTGNTIKTYTRFIGESAWNAESAPKDVKEGVGRLSIAAAFAPLTEVVLANSSPIVKYLKIENTPDTENILGISFKAGQEASRSEMKVKVRVEFTEPELDGAKKLENIEIVDIERN